MYENIINCLFYCLVPFTCWFFRFGNCIPLIIYFLNIIPNLNCNRSIFQPSDTTKTLGEKDRTSCCTRKCPLNWSMFKKLVQVAQKFLNVPLRFFCFIFKSSMNYVQRTPFNTYWRKSFFLLFFLFQSFWIEPNLHLGHPLSLVQCLFTYPDAHLSGQFQLRRKFKKSSILNTNIFVWYKYLSFHAV